MNSEPNTSRYTRTIAQPAAEKNQTKSYRQQTINFALCQAIAHKSVAPLREKGFLMILATWVIDGAECWPSIDSIAGRARVSDRTVQGMLSKLEAMGELKINRGASKHGTHIYTFCCALPGYRPQEPGVKQRGEKSKCKLSPDINKESPSNSVPVPAPTSLLEIHRGKDGKESEPAPAPAILKLKFGEMGNVLLSSSEHQRLQTTLGGVLAEAYIRRLDFHMASRGVRYASHYATIVLWAEKDQRNSTGGNGNGQQQWESKSKRQEREQRENYEAALARLPELTGGLFGSDNWGRSRVHVRPGAGGSR